MSQDGASSTRIRYVVMVASIYFLLFFAAVREICNMKRLMSLHPKSCSDLVLNFEPPELQFEGWNGPIIVELSLTSPER